MRKGVLFSFIMVFLTITLISLIMIQRSLITHSREHIFIESRIKSMNSLHESLVRDVGKSLEIIARRALSVAFNNVTSPPGIYLDKADERLKELILEGTLYGRPEALMENTTLSNWTDKIEAVSRLKGFNVNLDPQTLEIKPYDSFNLMIELGMYINISDRQGVASLNRFAQINQLVSIEELEDPLYPLYTGGKGSNMIIRTTYEGDYTKLLVKGSDVNANYAYGNTTTDKTNFDDKILICQNASDNPGLGSLPTAKGVVSEENGLGSLTIPYVINDSVISEDLIANGINVLIDGATGVWNIDNLREHANNSYYRPSENGPSYLDRLEGNLTCNYCDGTNIIGLESLVNKKQFDSRGIPVKLTKTNIDYIYFNDTFNPSAELVKGFDDYSFWLDDEDEHWKIYNVTDIVS